MERFMLKSKIHRAVVTETNLEYEGSISLDPELMAQADLLPYERVDIYNINNGIRFQTYLLAGEASPGQVIINGAAARLCGPGDRIIIASYIILEEDRARTHIPRLVYVDKNNRIIKRRLSKVG